MIHDEASRGVLLLGLIGVFTGLGQLLTSKETLSIRLVIGRAISSGSLGMAAGATLAVSPTLPLAAQMGMAAIIASLGTSFLEKIAQRFFGGN